MTLQTTSYELMGGLDQVTPGIRVPPGKVLAARNYEPSPDGYRRIDGFERFDGQLSPSNAHYWMLELDRDAPSLSIGDIISRSSGETALILDIVDARKIVLGKGGEYFAQNDEIRYVDGGDITTIGVIINSLHADNADQDASDRAWKAMAIDQARQAIQPVPGSGPIRGVTAIKGTVYAFRDNAQGDACQPFKATDTGWQPLNASWSIPFETGGSFFEEGTELVGSETSARATIKRVILESGHWDSGDAAGRFILSDLQGHFSATEVIGATRASDHGASLAVSAGTESEITLDPGGHFRFITYNFYGKSDHFRLYAVDGINPPFEMVGDTIIPIHTGVEDRFPDHIAAYRNHLFFGYEGGAMMHSGVGDPHAWTAVLGASELAIGADITGMISSVRNNLVVFCRNTIKILSGTSPLDWNLQEFADETGAIEGSAQKMFDPIFLDDRGIRSLSTTEQYGDFKIGSYSKHIDPFIKAKRGLVTTSVRVRKKDQYRLFFEDKTGLILDISKGEPEFMPLEFPHSVGLMTSVESRSGEEILLMAWKSVPGGSQPDTGYDEGMIYEMDRGTSFDGQPISAYLRLPFVNLGSPTQNKRFLKATLELDAEPNTEIQFTADFSYGDPDLPAHDEQAFQISGSGAFWDIPEWNDFFWSSQIEGLAEAHLDGFGTNLSMIIMSSSADAKPHSLHGVTIHWSPRGMNR